jgi:hypothetical protein
MVQGELMEQRHCKANYDHAAHEWEETLTEGMGKLQYDRRCPGGAYYGYHRQFNTLPPPERTKEEAVLGPVYNQQHTGEVLMSERWPDEKSRAVALELAVKTFEWVGTPGDAPTADEASDEILVMFDKFYLAIIGEGRPPQSRTESGL